MRDTLRKIEIITIGLWMVFSGIDGLWATVPASSCVRAVVDRTGTRVSLPFDINRIVVTCYGGASHEIAVLGGAAKVVAQPAIDRFPLLTKIYKPFVHVPDAGSFDNVNLETILGLTPDVVFAGVISTQGNQRIRELGIPVVVLGIGRTDIDSLLEEFTMVGGILNAEQTAAELVGYWEAKLSLIRARTNTIDRKDIKKVFYGSTGPPFRTEGGQWWGHHFIQASGGINVAENVQIKGGVTPEQLLVWDPDVIITSTNIGGHSAADGISSQARYRNLDAVQNNAIYACPIGTFWWDRPSPEAILGILWLAKILYPGPMKDINLKTETMQFFSRFYHYRLTETEFNAFFARGIEERTP